MRLPAHIVDLPCHARLCLACTEQLLKQSLSTMVQAGMFENGSVV